MFYSTVYFGVIGVRRHLITLFIPLVLLFVSRVSATVLDFEDLAFNQVLTGSSYKGLVWETGDIGVFGGSGQWAVPSLGFHPHSGIHNIINSFGSTLIGIAFPDPVAIGGAYVAVQGNGDLAWARRLKVHGFLAGEEVGTTDWFEPISTTPAWFDMSALTDVDRILFEAPAAFENEAYYGIDDLTFTQIPEPASLGIIGIAAFSLLTFRKRSK